MTEIADFAKDAYLSIETTEQYQGIGKPKKFISAVRNSYTMVGESRLYVYGYGYDKQSSIDDLSEKIRGKTLILDGKIQVKVPYLH